MARIHFASAMTTTGKNEDFIRDDTPSYLDIVEFIQFSGVHVTQDLHQLWRRIIYNIFISNTDDHLRNRAGVYFRLTDKEMQSIIDEVRASVANWQKVAAEIGISRNEQMLMNGAFRI